MSMRTVMSLGECQSSSAMHRSVRILAWNLTAGGFYKGELCSFSAGMIPFVRTKAERQASGDPRLSLEERYGDHAGYVAAVKAAAAKAVSQGFLLQSDAAALIEQAAASNVLNP